MSNEEFENYVALMGKLLQLTPSQREQISGELQDHLQMRVADLVDEGVPKPAAISQALEEFGDAAAMAKNFQMVHKLNRQRWMMRFTTYAIAGSFLVAVLAMAMWPEQARFGTPSQSFALSDAGEANEQSVGQPVRSISHATLQNLKAENALKKIVTLDYDDEPFSDIEYELESMAKLNFLLDTSAMDDSLTADEPVTFNLRDVSLSKALKLMLSPKNATYFIDEGVVRIISLDYAEDTKYMRLKMFDCRELVKRLPKTAPKPFALQDTIGIGGGDAGGGVFSMPVQFGRTSEVGTSETNEPAETSDSKLLDQKISEIMMMLAAHAEREKVQASSEYTLLSLVQEMIEPDSWVDTGTGLAQIRVSNGMLIVRQTESALIKIENMLQDLSANVLAPVGQSVGIPLAPEKLTRLQPEGTQPAASTSSGDNPFGGETSSEPDPFGID